MKNSPTPTFPSWNEVTISLFLNTSDTTKDKKNESLKSFLQLLNQIPKEYHLPPNGMEQIMLVQKSDYQRRLALSELSEAEVKEQLENLPLSGNQFHLIGNTASQEYIMVSENSKNLMGLKSASDFTFMKVCGMDETDELFHPEDVEHLIRFGTCALIIAGLGGFTLNPFTDYYEVNFRTGWSEVKKCKTIRRRCYLSNWPEGVEGTRHFDTWRVVDGHDKFDYLHWLLHLSNSKSITLLNGMFYVLNCVFLGITPQEALLANLLTVRGNEYKKEFNLKIANALGLDAFKYENQQTYFNQKSQLKKKIDKLILNTTKGSRFKSNPSNSTFHFRCGQLGILGMDQNLSECIWKNLV